MRDGKVKNLCQKYRKIKLQSFSMQLLTEVSVQIQHNIFLNIVKSSYRVMKTFRALTPYVCELYFLKILLNSLHLNGHTLLYTYTHTAFSAISFTDKVKILVN